MDLYICTTYYHVYVLLLKRQTGFQEACDVVLCKDILTCENLKQSLDNSGLFVNVWCINQWKMPEDIGKNRLDRLFFQHHRRYRTIKKMLPFDVKKYDNVYIFHDDTMLGRYLNDAQIKYHLIEDSYNFFQHILQTPQAIHLREKNYKYKLAKLLNMGYFPMGESKYIVDIEVNENKNLQISNQKIVEISRDMMRDSLSEEDKQLIFKIFGSPKLPQIDQDTVILLTEPFSTDGVCSDEKQIIIYKVIIDDLIEKGLTVLIKPHPRDKMDYSIFGVDVIDRFFPMEVLVDQVGEKIQNIATVSSSAALSINAKNIYKYDFLQIKGEDNE